MKHRVEVPTWVPVAVTLTYLIQICSYTWFAFTAPMLCIYPMICLLIGAYLFEPVEMLSHTVNYFRRQAK